MGDRLAGELAKELATALEGYRYEAGTETAVQDGIERILNELRFDFEREARLTSRDRVDFLVFGVAVEVKIGGSLSSVVRQLHRYAASDRVEAILLVTTQLRLARVPRSLGGKPVHVAALLGGLL